MKKRMLQIILLLAVPCLLLTTSLMSEESQHPDEAKAVAEGKAAPEMQDTYLSMPEPPLGYTVMKQQVMHGDAVGYVILVSNPTNGNRVTITIDMSVRSEKTQRVAAVKGYINGLVETFQKHEFTLKSKDSPDLEEADFNTPLTASLHVVSKDGTSLYVHKRMFFTDKGFDVTVVARTPENLKALLVWADKIKPAEPAKADRE